MLGEARVEAFVGVTDPARARVFYEETLGLRLVEDNGFAALFAGPNVMIRVTQVAEVGSAEYTVLGWVVEDIAAVVDGLASRGVDFLDFPGMDQDPRRIWTAPGGDRVAWFHDPDGNTLSVGQPA